MQYGGAHSARPVQPLYERAIGDALPLAGGSSGRFSPPEEKGSKQERFRDRNPAPVQH